MSDERPHLVIGPAEEARVHAIVRPDRALLASYAFQALAGAFTLAAVAGLLVLKAGKAGAAEAIAEWARKAPLLVVGGLVLLYGVVFLGLVVRWSTLRYRFDDQGVARTWGLLFRRETFLTYTKIQDIQLRRNLVERWFGIARLAIQTASAQTADETIEGLRDYELVQAYLREKMKGTPLVRRAPPTALAPDEDPLALLASIRDEVRALREPLARRRSR